MHLNKLIHEIDDIRDTFISYKEEPKLSERSKDSLGFINNELLKLRERLQKDLDKVTSKTG